MYVVVFEQQFGSHEYVFRFEKIDEIKGFAKFSFSLLSTIVTIMIIFVMRHLFCYKADCGYNIFESPDSKLMNYIHLNTYGIIEIIISDESTV